MKIVEPNFAHEKSRTHRAVHMGGLVNNDNTPALVTIISHLDTEPLPLLFPMGAGQTQRGAGESKDSQKFAAECVSLNKNNNSKMEKLSL